MLIDSGSDATLVPRQIVDALSIVTTQETLAVELVNGERSALQVVRMQMKWDRYTVNGEFLVTDGDFGIIGRDILNRVRLLLNGPAQTWSFT